MLSLVTATNVTARDIVKGRTEEFLSEMSAKDIASTLKLYDLIPEEVVHDITHAKSRGAANEHLLTFLTEKATEKQVQGIFKFASGKKDYGRMSQFATTILQQLQQGHSVVYAIVYPRHASTNVLYKRQCLHGLFLHFSMYYASVCQLLASNMLYHSSM